jgi:hypothetical protein
MTQKSPEQLEWERVRGLARQRRLPGLVGFAVGALMSLVGFAATHALLDADSDAKQARIERGEVVYERRAGPAHVLLLVGLPVLVGLGAGTLAFRLMGGKLSAEHVRGLKRLSGD